jgi:hypothetical protein
MNPHAQTPAAARKLDTGLRALCGIAGFYGIPADPDQLAADLGLIAPAESADLVRAARRLGLRARLITIANPDRAARMPRPSISLPLTAQYACRWRAASSELGFSGYRSARKEPDRGRGSRRSGLQRDGGDGRDQNGRTSDHRLYFLATA